MSFGYLTYRRFEMSHLRGYLTCKRSVLLGYLTYRRFEILHLGGYLTNRRSMPLGYLYIRGLKHYP